MSASVSPGQVISEFGERESTPAFTHINKPALIQQLLKRVKEPWHINQASSSLCGPASFLYCVAKKSPGLYARYIVNLYETGVAKIGDLEIEPSDDCRNYKIPPKSIPEADWIGLASLRDSENTFQDYDDIGDALPGATFPGDVEDWFKAANFKPVLDETNLLFTKPLSNLLAAHQAHSAWKKVFLYDRADSIDCGAKNQNNFIRYHLVVLNSPISINEKSLNYLLSKGKEFDNDDDILSRRIRLSVYTWGTDKWTVAAKTVKDFLNGYYGYISAA